MNMKEIIIFLSNPNCGFCTVFDEQVKTNNVVHEFKQHNIIFKKLSIDDDKQMDEYYNTYQLPNAPHYPYIFYINIDGTDIKKYVIDDRKKIVNIDVDYIRSLSLPPNVIRFNQKYLKYKLKYLSMKLK